MSYAEIESLCGPKVRAAVELLTKKLDGVRVPDPVYYERTGHDPIASIAKALDRAHNIFTMSAAGWSVGKQERYVGEVFDLLLPMMKVARRQFTKQEAGLREREDPAAGSGQAHQAESRTAAGSDRACAPAM
ncbi:MAG: hypothetical protein EOR01_23545 [Mesorhizobium sp.]|uniref:hypothetical protein n=1 Tax=Mesorhizobium sp. TaxID=1871066 RepID=UPI000FE61996|nr:hypothetical protein [Mesorhizobium sp.]RWP18001.1 MAG: hypothetical protein EOR01_23545 [Mesorhizobium sp.]